MLLMGAAPNGIAFESRQFAPAEFFRYGVCASVIFMLASLGFILVIWPAMGMSILRN
jgi:solute carrier family 13 (sodium-dependent dicarboxylate transporter), member 2/3/5